MSVRLTNYPDVTYEQAKVLNKARKTYGNKAQIAVVAEECCELEKELLKYLRYDSHDRAVDNLRKGVLDEVADVLICLNHVACIFDIRLSELEAIMKSKINRLEGWLDKSDSPELTTIERELK